MVQVKQRWANMGESGRLALFPPSASQASARSGSSEKEMWPTHLLALVQSSETRQPSKARVKTTSPSAGPSGRPHLECYACAVCNSVVCAPSPSTCKCTCASARAYARARARDGRACRTSRTGATSGRRCPTWAGKRSETGALGGALEKLQGGTAGPKRPTLCSTEPRWPPCASTRAP